MSLSEFPIPPLPPKGQEYRHTPPCKLHYTVWVYVWVWVSVSSRWCSRVRGKVIYCPVSDNGRKWEYTALCGYNGIIHSLFNLAFKIALTVFLLINVYYVNTCCSLQLICALLPLWFWAGVPSENIQKLSLSHCSPG